jgi:hypothetical protein
VKQSDYSTKSIRGFVEIKAKDIQVVDISSLVPSPKNNNKYKVSSEGIVYCNGEPMCVRPGKNSLYAINKRVAQQRIAEARNAK